MSSPTAEPAKPSSTEAAKVSKLRSIGRGAALSGVIAAHMILIPTGIYALWLILRKPKLTAKARATVLDVTQTPFPLLQYEFFAPTRVQPYQPVVLTWRDEFSKFTKGQAITVYYDPSDTNFSDLQSDETRGTGWFTLLVVVVLLALVLWGYSRI
jgi:hypothetical protein